MDPKRVQKLISFVAIFWFHFGRPNLTPEAQFVRDVSCEMQIFRSRSFKFSEKYGAQMTPKKGRKTIWNFEYTRISGSLRFADDS